jgi:hypothetical protein
MAIFDGNADRGGCVWRGGVFVGGLGIFGDESTGTCGYNEARSH